MPAKRNKVSAGLLMYRRRDGELQVFLAHPGGPFFARKDAGAWTIPKGEIEPGDDAVTTARREFAEEIGLEAPYVLLPLGSIRQKGGKVVHAWAFEGEFEDGRTVQSNTFTMQWPPGSGRMQQFPEVDRAQFFDLAAARVKIIGVQAELIDRLAALLASR